MNGNGEKKSFLVAAEKLIERGQLDEALLELGRIVAEEPTDTRAWLKMAELHARLGANAEAAAICSRLGELYIDQGYAQKAVGVYKNALKLAPGVPKGHLRLGMLYKQLGLVSESVQQFELAGASLQRAGAPAEAAGAFRQAVAADPSNPVLRVRLAEAASLAGLIDEAVREFGRAAEQLKGQGRIDESLRVTERLLFHQPENVTRARELAEAYIAKGNPRLALPKLQSCLNAAPREPRTLALLARALEQLGQTDKAAEVLKELVRLCHELGRSAERDVALARALELAPGDAEAQALAVRHGLRGAAGARSEATPLPVRASGSGGSSSGGSFDLSGGVRSALGSGGSARVAAPLIVGESSARVLSSPVSTVAGAGGVPDVPRILAESEVFVKYGLLERAVDHLGRVFDLEPENREARERLSAVLQKLGRTAEAARQLEILAQQLARTSPGEARRFADRAAALDPAGARGRVAASPVADRGAVPSPAVGFAPLPRTARELDDDPNATVRTPPPAPLLEPEDQATPPPEVMTSGASVPNAGSQDHLKDEPSDRSGFEQIVSTGDVVAVDDARARARADDDAGEEEEGGYPVTPPPATTAAPPPGWTVEPTPQVVALTRKPAGGARRQPAAPQVEDDEDPEGGFEVIAATTASGPARPLPADEDRITAVDGGAPSADELGEELEQVAFFLAQALPDEARALLADLAQRFPGDARVVARLREIAAYEGRMAAAESALAARAAESGMRGAAPGGRRNQPSGGEAPPAPRAFVEAGGAADASTHFDLAIAYKEMGLLDAAIGELKVVADDPEREVMALTTMGECFEAKGSFTDAVIRYKEALNCTPITTEETMQLYFLLGGAFDRLGDASEALYFYEKVARRDPRFRDVDVCIAALKPKLEKTPKTVSP